MHSLSDCETRLRPMTRAEAQLMAVSGFPFRRHPAKRQRGSENAAVAV